MSAVPDIFQLWKNCLTTNVCDTCLLKHIPYNYSRESKILLSIIASRISAMFYIYLLVQIAVQHLKDRTRHHEVIPSSRRSSVLKLSSLHFSKSLSFPGITPGITITKILFMSKTIVVTQIQNIIQWLRPSNSNILNFTVATLLPLL